MYKMRQKKTKIEKYNFQRIEVLKIRLEMEFCEKYF
jgi:hypothetical protein